MGFIAEQIREGITERHLEKEYITSLVHDLANDTLYLQAGFPKKDQRIEAIDSVFLFFETHPAVTVIPGSVYVNMERSTWDRIFYNVNSITIEQLINSAGMRYIQNKRIANAIMFYSNSWKRGDFYASGYVEHQRREMNLLNRIVNIEGMLNMYRKANITAHVTHGTIDSMQIKIDRTFLPEFLNALFDQKTFTRQDKQSYQSLEQTAGNLIKMIKEEYHLEKE